MPFLLITRFTSAAIQEHAPGIHVALIPSDLIPIVEVLFKPVDILPCVGVVGGVGVGVGVVVVMVVTAVCPYCCTGTAVATSYYGYYISNTGMLVLVRFKSTTGCWCYYTWYVVSTGACTAVVILPALLLLILVLLLVYQVNITS